MTASKNMISQMRLVSYGFMLLVFILAAWLHLATPILVALFGMFALKMLHVSPCMPKWSVVLLFLLLVSGVGYGLGRFTQETVKNLPKIAEKSVPQLIDWARERGIDLPALLDSTPDGDSGARPSTPVEIRATTPDAHMNAAPEPVSQGLSDYKEMKRYLIDQAREKAYFLAGLLRTASLQIIFFIVGIVVAVSIFLSPRTELDRHEDAVPENLYALFCDTVAERFALLFGSFRIVMGAQLAISLINTVLTAGFVLAVGMPHPVIIIGVTFLCGLLPVIGNLISNTVIVAIGLTVSPAMAAGALAFLVAIHKLEYFLNSRIIGSRIRNPMWLMLLSLILGEKLMGIPGMILAPILLHYVKSEMSRLKLPKDAAAAPAAPAAGDSTP